MQDIYVNKPKVLTVPSGATSLTITHEWGDSVLATTAVSGTYSFTPDSIGIHKLLWKNGATLVRTDFYSSCIQLVSADVFFDQFTDQTAQEDNFPFLERKVRGIIETFTGQKFGPYVGKQLEIQGAGGDALELPVRITTLTSLEDNWAEDLTDLVEISAGTEWFLNFKSSYRYFNDVKRDLTKHRRDFFTERLSFNVTGDFGWEFVPPEVEEAAKLLILDDMTGANDLRQHGINESQLGDFSYKLNADQWGTTGNTQADLLLAQFVVLRLGLA